ncbi:hypothetical protein J6590_033783 [Homalodisca vitripennis]|nr:hypothetical protein J6590_033783 [Homalodisca vitripennis]
MRLTLSHVLPCTYAGREQQCVYGGGGSGYRWGELATSPRSPLHSSHTTCGCSRASLKLSTVLYKPRVAAVKPGTNGAYVGSARGPGTRKKGRRTLHHDRQCANCTHQITTFDPLLNKRITLRDRRLEAHVLPRSRSQSTNTDFYFFIEEG